MGYTGSMYAPPSRPAKPQATLADYLAIPEHERFHELIGGQLIQKAQPSPRHSNAQAKLAEALGPFARRAGGPDDRPGGWWILTEADAMFGADLLRPDVAGWRRERLPTLPDAPAIDLTPDWVCEIISKSNPGQDRIWKKRIYHRFGVPHYWLLDPAEESLTVYRWQEDGYLEVLVAARTERIHAEPFQAIELAVGALLGDDD